ncbi:MAG: DUF2202 domain-containing protein, partial [Holophagales bacterium]|nr:DUF2202 domain-containing protein [Holophagales bacterium]
MVCRCGPPGQGDWHRPWIKGWQRSSREGRGRNLQGARNEEDRLCRPAPPRRPARRPARSGERTWKRNGEPGAGAAGGPRPIATYVASLPKEAPSAAETEQILFLREEEKLARDVYRALFAANGDRSFANIAGAEQRHMDEVKLLLDRYALADPAATAAGEFRNARLASLYTDLVARGKVSLVEALKVGATIEDLDLSDVDKALQVSDNRDIDAVMQNLAKGSRNHLRAFSSSFR